MRRFVVTGASRGIGLACVARLRASAPAGSTIWAVARSFPPPEELPEGLRSTPSCTVVPHVLDVNSAPDCEAFFASTLGDAGCDVLVNNAGGGQDGLALRLSDEAYAQAMTLNFASAVRLTRLALRGMIKRRFGRVIQMSSMATKGNPGQSAYASAKAALDSYTRSAAREVAPRGVTINAVAPGFVDTAMTQKLSPELQQRVAQMAALGRMGESDEIASVVEFLASDRASYVTAQVVEVHGGLGR